jgi:hypothetical protein
MSERPFSKQPISEGNHSPNGHSAKTNKGPISESNQSSEDWLLPSRSHNGPYQFGGAAALVLMFNIAEDFKLQLLN